jgi:hypothetical protein
LNLAWLVRGDLAGARVAIAEAGAALSHRGYHVQHYFTLLAELNCDLYAADAGAAAERIDRVWPALSRSMLLHYQLIRIVMAEARGRVAILLARAAPDPTPHLRVAVGCARVLERQRTSWSDPMAMLLRAQIARLRGDQKEAAASLARATVGFEEAEMALYAMATRDAWGRLVHGSKGERLVEATARWMSTQGVVDPARLVAMIAPGFTDLLPPADPTDAATRRSTTR